MNTVGTLHFAPVITVNQVFVVLLDALVRLLYTTSRRGIITCHRQTDHRTVRQVDRALHQSFTETAPSHYHSTVPVLQGSGHNLTGRSRKLINQHHHPSVAERTVSFRLKFGTRITASFGIYNQFFLSQELVYQVDSRIQITSAVALKVQNQVFHTLFLQVLQGSGKLLAGGSGKAADTDITHLLVDHIRGIQAVNRNLVALDGKRNQSVGATTHHLDVDFGAFLAPQTAHHLLHAHLHSSDDRVIDFDNPVSGQYSDLFGRTSRYRLNDKQGVGSHVKLNADAVEVSQQRLVQPFHLFRIGISGMRVQFFQHTDNRTLHQFVFVH